MIAPSRTTSEATQDRICFVITEYLLLEQGDGQEEG